MKNHIFIFGLLVLLILAAILKLSFDALDVDHTDAAGSSIKKNDSKKNSGPAPPLDMNRVFAVVNRTPLKLKQIPKNEFRKIKQFSDPTRQQKYLRKIIRNEIEKFLVKHFIAQTNIQVTPEEVQNKIDYLQKEKGQTIKELATAKGVTKDQYLDTIRTSIKLEKVLGVNDEKRLRQYYQENKKEFLKKMPQKELPKFKVIQKEIKSFYFRHHYAKLIQRLWKKSQIQTKFDLGTK